MVGPSVFVLVSRYRLVLAKPDFPPRTFVECWGIAALFVITAAFYLTEQASWGDKPASRPPQSALHRQIRYLAFFYRSLSAVWFLFTYWRFLHMAELANDTTISAHDSAADCHMQLQPCDQDEVHELFTVSLMDNFETHQTPATCQYFEIYAGTFCYIDNLPEGSNKLDFINEIIHLTQEPDLTALINSDAYKLYNICNRNRGSRILENFGLKQASVTQLIPLSHTKRSLSDDEDDEAQLTSKRANTTSTEASNPPLPEDHDINNYPAVPMNSPTYVRPISPPAEKPMEDAPDDLDDARMESDATTAQGNRSGQKPLLHIEFPTSTRETHCTAISKIVGYKVTCNYDGHYFRMKLRGEEHFREVQAYLDSNNIGFRTHDPKHERPKKVVIKGIPCDTPLQEIEDFLREQGFVPIHLNWFRDPDTRERRPSCLVALKNTANFEEVYELSEYEHLIITITSYRAPKVKQCYNCQGYGHSSYKCTITPRCLKCAGPHRFRDCPTKGRDPVLCANGQLQ